MYNQEIKYAIWVEFDDEYTKFLDEKCKELDKYEIGSGIRPPHLTLTFVRTDNVKKLIDYTKTFIKNNNVEVEINNIGMFEGGILFYAPKVSSELLKFQNDFCEGISEFGELAWDLYYPGNWTPHVALTGELDENKTNKAFLIVQSGFGRRKVEIKRIVVKSCEDGTVVANISV